MSPDERQKRRQKVASAAIESVSKTEQFNFRMEAATIKRLYKRAEAEGKPVGALVREWVTEKLDEGERAPSPVDILLEIQKLQKQTRAGLKEISQEISSLRNGSY
ncbi:MAG: hypothetical protein JST01_01035 [Cyanobacteria bacterium SZAS TMP-1]|nr:hypothetical protein [Cyanobacteria bacterium SZAS TMP-1]